MGKAYWKSVKIGDLIPHFTKPPLSRVQFVLFAAATKDYNPLHIDDDFAHMNGFGGAFGQGNLTLSFLEEGLHQFAENGKLIRLLGTFHKMVWPGDVLTSKAIISDKFKHNGEFRIELDTWIENQHQEIVAKGQASYILWDSEKTEAQHNYAIPTLSEASREDIIKTIRSKLAQLARMGSPEDEIASAATTPEKESPSPKKSSPTKRKPAKRKTTS